MNRFNLLEEPWIFVISDTKGSLELVSLVQLFQNAHKYKQLAGETQMQNFAILRMLLAVLHTVFSRFDAEGEPYPYLVLGKRFKQLEIAEDDLEEHRDNLMKTWENLWKRKSFPDIVIDYYLSCWRDRFYLFATEHPFYQVTREKLVSVLSRQAWN